MEVYMLTLEEYIPSFFDGESVRPYTRDMGTTEMMYISITAVILAFRGRYPGLSPVEVYHRAQQRHMEDMVYFTFPQAVSPQPIPRGTDCHSCGGGKVL